MFQDLRLLFRDRQFQSIAIAQFLNVGSSSLLNPILPLYLAIQGMSPTKIGIIMGIAAAGALLIRPWAGRSVDRRGSKPVIFWGQSLMGLCFVAYIFFTEFAPLLIVRFLHGVAMALYGTASVTFASCIGAPDLTASAISLYTVCTMIGLGSATSLSPLLFDRFGFNTLACTSIGAILLAILVIRWRACHIPPLPEAKQAPFFSVMRFQNVWVPTVCIFGSSFVFSAAMIFVPLLALAEKVDSFWLFYVCFAVAVVVTRLGVRSVTELLSTQQLSTWAGVLNIACSLFIGLVPAGWSFGLGGILLGLGFGVIFPALTVFVVQRVDPSIRGTALSILTASGDVGHALGASALGVVADFWGFRALFIVSALVVLACTVYCHPKLKSEK